MTDNGGGPVAGQGRIHEEEAASLLGLYTNFRYFDNDGAVSFGVFGSVQDAKACIKALRDSRTQLSTGPIWSYLMSSWVRTGSGN